MRARVGGWRPAALKWAGCFARVRLSGRRPALASMMVIGGLLVFMLAIIGLAVNMTGYLDMVYMDLALTLPRFDYSIEDGVESGNETFQAFAQMRYVAGGMMGAALLWAGVSRAIEGTGTGLAQPGTSNRIISRSLVFLVIFLVFPPAWDGGAGVVEGAALWVLNPHYSFDADRPCPEGWSDEEILRRHADSPYGRGEAQTPGEAKIVCEPQLKVRYVFGQMMGATELQETKQAYLTPDDPFGALTADVQNFAEAVLVNTFLGLTKALVTINVLMMAFIIGIMADLLVGMIIAALPLFLMMSLVPRAEQVANRFLDALPALFLLPLMSAVVIVVGAGFIAQAGAGDCGPAGCPGEGSQAAAVMYAWISSLGVVFFAVSLPVLLVPLLGQVTQVASRAVTGAIQTAATVAGTGAAGAVQGVRSGLAQPGGVQGLSGLARTIGAGTLGGLMGGLSGARKAGTGGFAGIEPAIPVGGAAGAAGSALAGGTPALVDMLTRESATGDVERGLSAIGSEAGALRRLREAGVGDLPRFSPGGDRRAYYDAIEEIRGAAPQEQRAAWDAYAANESWESRMYRGFGDDGVMAELAEDVKKLSRSRHDIGVITLALHSKAAQNG